VGNIVYHNADYGHDCPVCGLEMYCIEADRAAGAFGCESEDCPITTVFVVLRNPGNPDAMVEAYAKVNSWAYSAAEGVNIVNEAQKFIESILRPYNGEEN
jgi:uncharacterized membrane protein